MLLRLFLRSARPLLAAVETWVTEARLPATHSEFFVAAGARTAEWHSGCQCSAWAVLCAVGA